VLTCSTGERSGAAKGGTTRKGGGGRAASPGSTCGRGDGSVRARIERGSGGGGACAANRATAHRRLRIAAAGGAEWRGRGGARVRPGEGERAAFKIEREKRR
jgi:hypothetical protein